MFKEHKRFLISEIPELTDFCMQFYYTIPPPGQDGVFSSTLIFAKHDSIITFDYETREVKTVVKFEIPILAQP